MTARNNLPDLPIDPPEPKPSGLCCRCCMEDIPQGSTYYEIDGSVYCEGCVRDGRRTADMEDWI
ncbi:MAG: hypothetical protein VB078_06990 [Clostridiaceae bacterium]|nr:hypothetical protein [Clostridiaceae bacterium]